MPPHTSAGPAKGIFQPQLQLGVAKLGMFKTEKISSIRALEQLETFFEAECWQINRKVDEFREGRAGLAQGCQAVNQSTLFH